MVDFASARRMMVDGQIRPNDVTDLQLLAAFLDIPRERFVPSRQAPLAYLDLDVPLNEGPAQRYLLQSMTVAKLLQVATILPTDHVLDVGAATGYTSAVLSRIAGSVVALEQDGNLARTAAEILPAVGADKVMLVNGPLTAGCAAHGSYDVIVMSGGATEIVPTELCAQLKDGGRLVCILGNGPGSKAMLYSNTGGEITARPLFDAAAPVLPGFTQAPAFTF
jgi:protein-L-isoaspartate(D-aspartate) O-methyltransferase